MKFWNKENSFVPVGPRESVPPYGVTRDFTEEEVAKNHELRDKLDRGMLIPWDGKSALPSKAKVPTAPALPTNKSKPLYTIAPDSIGGELKQVQTGKTAVTYVVADTEGVDDVQNAVKDPEIMAALPEEGRPTDYIEEGVSGREVVDGQVQLKTQWKNASQAFEEEITKETTEDIEFDDSQILAEGDDADRQDALDADHEIASDYSQVLQKGGKMGASLTTTAQIAQDAATQASQAIASAVAPNVDDGEVVSGVSKEVADFLEQPFFSKKWLIAKSTDADFLRAVGAATKSENLKSLVDQRLAELEAK